MSSGTVAASDPGGGEPKLAPGADVEMTEAAGEVAAAPAAGVDVEEKSQVVREGDAAAEAMDVEQEGGDAAAPVSDPLYATEYAGMVTEEGRGDEPAEGVNGGGGDGEEKVQVGAVGLQNEAETKMVPARDVAAPAVAGQAVEAASSAAPGLTVADAGGENKERDNGVAYTDNEIQKNVPSDVEGSSNIHEDDGAPKLGQPDDKPGMLLQTEEHVPGTGDNPSSNEAATPGNVVQCARYRLPPLDKSGFQVSDLVWGKVKSHPWWPGEIFDPSDASDLALKHQKKDNHLVAYFGDSTFAWCDESQLKPFVTHYSQMEKQSSSDAFVSSVNNALEELSRRILSGMSCSCLPEELSDSGMSYTVENAGLKDGVTCSAVNRVEILKCFSPENLLHYIKELALFPGQGGDLLELVIACSQLTSFYRSKGCSELASFQTGDAWVEDGMDTPSTQNVLVEEDVISEVQPTQDKPKRGRGRPRKQKSEFDQEVMEKKDTSNLNNDSTYRDTVARQMGMEFDDFDNLESKKKRNFDSFEDSEKPSTPTVGSSFKIGDCIRRAASQLAGSSSIVKAQNEPTVHKSTADAENGEFDVVSDDADDELTVLNRAKRRRMYRNHTADPCELLSQLCVAATEPMNGHSFLAMIISYFSDYRNYVVSTTTEASIVEKGTSKRGRKRKVLPSPEVETTDHMQDSYWSGLSLHNHPIHNLTKESSTTRPRRRRRSTRQTYVPLSELGPQKKQIQVVERSIIHVDEKMVDELKPTALVLSFGRSAAVPSELDLIKMFSRYGPLKETDTEVQKNTNIVKVVFKKRSDAERAFSAAGKYGTFGPSLRSYRLVNMPFSLGSETNNPEAQTEDRGPEVPGPSDSNVPLDAMQIDEVDKTDKAEFVEEPSVEQVEIGKQTSQGETADRALISQVDMVEKSGETDVELTGHVDQSGTGAQAESVAVGSSEQVSSIEQFYTQKEASFEGVSEVSQSEALTGASNGCMIGKNQQGEAPNQALIDDTTNTMQMEVSLEAQTEDTVMQAFHDATNEESAQVVLDNMQTNLVAEAPKMGHISGNSAVFEVVAEVPATAHVAEVPAEGMVSLELQSQISNGKPVEQDVTEQKIGFEAPKQGVSGEVPSSSKMEAEASTAEPVVEGTGEQVQVESQTFVEVGEQAYSIEQTVQVEAVTEASGGQIEVGRQTSEGECVADAINENSIMVEETLESKVEVPVEEYTENNAPVAGQVEEISEEQTAAEAPDEKIENEAAAAEALAVETRDSEIVSKALNEKTENKAEAAETTKEGEITVEAPFVKKEDKAIVEPIAGEKAEGESTAEALAEETRRAEESTAEAPFVKKEDRAIVEPIAGEKAEGESTAEALAEETRRAEGTVENVKALDDKTNTDEKTVDDDAVVTPVEETTLVESQDGITTESEKTAEDATVEAPGEKSSAAEKPIEDTTVEAPGVQAG